MSELAKVIKLKDYRRRIVIMDGKRTVLPAPQPRRDTADRSA